MDFSDYQIYERIKKISRNRDFSIGKLEKELGVSIGLLKNACKKESLRVDVLLRVSEVLGVDIREFFGGADGVGVAGAGGAKALEECRSRIAQLEELLREKERVIASKERIIESKEEVIELLRKQ